MKLNKERTAFISLNIAFTALFFVVFFSYIFHAPYLMWLDNTIGSFFVSIRSEAGTVLFTLLTLSAQTVTIIALMLILLAFPNRKKVFLPLLILISVSVAVGLIMKYAVMRDRPFTWFAALPFGLTNPTGYSFPSGHALNGSVFYLGLTYLLLHFYKVKAETGKNYMVLAGGFCVLIAVSRLWLGVHYFSDVLAGLLLAGILLTNFVFLYKKFTKKDVHFYTKK